jgi:release factor glutamine methyltransferase
MSKSYLEVLNGASSFLEEAGLEGHAIEYLFLRQKNWTKTQWLLNMRKPIFTKDEELIAADLAQLLKNIPPQYILGYEEFFGRSFKVTEATLIPRPETEELIELCLQTNDTTMKSVVDVGTGTGIIPITLKLERPNWQLTSIDLSPAALAVARENATALAADVTLLHGDGLTPITDPVDIIISNPPYISEKEWNLMDVSVRTFEPKLALFADEDGLAMYHQIAKQAKSRLKPAGKIYLEIGFKQGPAVAAIFKTAFPDKQVDVRNDLFGNPRMVYVHD